MNPARIMVVEDTDSEARSIRSSVEELGYPVVLPVSTDADGVLAALDQCPDLVLMAVTPQSRITALKIARLIHEQAHIPSVFISSPEEKAARSAITDDPFGFLEKPFTSRELRIIIAAALYRAKSEKECAELAQALDEALEQGSVLRRLLPICANCKRIRDDDGFWSYIEEYISNRTEIRFTHSVCPDCMQKLYPKIPGL